MWGNTADGSAEAGQSHVFYQDVLGAIEGQTLAAGLRHWFHGNRVVVIHD